MGKISGRVFFVDSDVLYGVGLASLGIFSVFWWILKIISCILIAGLISYKICSLTGWYWWFSSIILFCILKSLVFFDTDIKPYNDLVDKYKKSVSDDEEEIV